MKTILRILWNRRKWGPLVIYLILAVFLWGKRTSLIYAYLPAQISIILCDLLLVSLILLGFVGILQETRCPFMTKAKVDLAFQQAGVKNGMGQHPFLTSVINDPSKKHGKRYTIKNLGVTKDEMELHKDSLQRELGVIYDMSDTTKPGKTYIYVMPGRSSIPTITSSTYDDDF